MRWDRLFADLEGQLAAGERRELDDEVAERTRRERALVTLDARLAEALGTPVVVGLVAPPRADPTRVQGEVLDLGQGWVLLRGGAGRDLLVPLAAVATVTWAGHPSPEGSTSAVHPAGASGSATPCGRCRATGPPSRSTS